MDEKKAEHLLDDAGVFWGHEGLRGLAESDEFWNKQTYGTRLYYGDGIADYLHRDVLRAAVRSMDALAARLAEAERDRDSAVALYGEAKVRADETERENASLSAQVAALEAQVAGVYEVRKEIGYLTYELDQGAAKCTANTLARIGGQLDAALSAAPEVVADRWPTVAWFAEAMRRKLDDNAEKGGWEHCYKGYLMGRLVDEARELQECVAGFPVVGAGDVLEEAADVANFAMMIADVLRRKEGE